MITLYQTQVGIRTLFDIAEGKIACSEEVKKEARIMIREISSPSNTAQEILAPALSSPFSSLEHILKKEMSKT